MTEQEWQKSTDPRLMLEFLRDKVSERKLRLFACGCCRQVLAMEQDLSESWRQSLLLRPSFHDGYAAEMTFLRNTVGQAENGADGQVDKEEWSAVEMWLRHPVLWADAGYDLGSAATLNLAPYTAYEAIVLTASVAFTTPFDLRHVAYWTSLAKSAMRFLRSGPELATQELDDNMAQLNDGNLEWLAHTEVEEANGYAVLVFFKKAQAENTDLLRDIFGNPFRPVAFDPAWRTPTVTAVAQTIYAERRFADMPILGDALEEAGCSHREILDHCRQPGEHVRGCWAVDLVLEKE